MNVSVIGMGRFGTLLAAMLTKTFRVLVYDRREELDLPEGTEKVTLQEALASSCVFLCVPISSFRSCIDNIAPLLAPGTLLVDTCSVKMYPARCMKERVAEGVHLIATHPMFGPDSVTGSSLPMVLHQLRAPDELYATFKDSMQRLGMQIIEMSPAQHDEIVAFTQGITHIIGRVLGDLSLPETDVATSGYKKLQDIVRHTCNDSQQLFLDIQRYNPFTERARLRLADGLEKINRMLDAAGSVSENKVE